MKIYRNTTEAGAIDNPIVTAGTFDGVHLGHKKIITRLKETAQKNKGETVVLTFDPHPRLVLFPDKTNLKLLNTLEEKTELLEQAGIQHLIIQPFTKDFANLSSSEFIKTILVENIKTQKLVIGYNHHFGKNREGSFEHLKKYGPVHGFDVEEIPAQDVDDIEVSSTRIRTALQQGEIKTANNYLGYNYFITGIVVKGKQLGKTIGCPTANIEVQDECKLIPDDGIYVVTVDYNGENYKGMMSIGMNPTVNGTKRTIEVNIFDFEKDIYGAALRVYFFEKIRDEAKFESVDVLKERLLLDKQESLRIFEKLKMQKTE